MDILITVHSILRWFIIIIAALAIFKYSVSWAVNRPFKGMDRGLASALSGLMDAQVLLGFVYFLWSGFAGAGFPGYRWLHMLIMVAAAVLMHVPGRLKALGDMQRFTYSIVTILGALVLVYIGVMFLPGGWTR